MNHLGCYTPAGLTEYLFVPEHVSLTCKIIMESVATHYSLPSLGEYLLVFAVTCLYELPFYYILLQDKSRSILKFMAILILCNLATHPIVYILMPYLGFALEWRFVSILMLAEIFAPLIEFLMCVFIFKTKPIKSLLLIVAANIISWWVGMYLT